MAPKVRVRRKDKDVGEAKSEKLKAHWTIANKKFFLEALKEKQKGTRLDKAFGWENIMKEFNTKKGT